MLTRMSAQSILQAHLNHSIFYPEIDLFSRNSQQKWDGNQTVENDEMNLSPTTPRKLIE
jgi:hypothetical protein